MEINMNIEEMAIKEILTDKVLDNLKDEYEDILVNKHIDIDFSEDKYKSNIDNNINLARIRTECNDKEHLLIMQINYGDTDWIDIKFGFIIDKDINNIDIYIETNRWVFDDKGEVDIESSYDSDYWGFVHRNNIYLKNIKDEFGSKIIGYMKELYDNFTKTYGYNCNFYDNFADYKKKK
jgi:hypothetical protein